MASIRTRENSGASNNYYKVAQPMQRPMKNEDQTTASLVKHLKDLTNRMDNMEKNYDTQIKTLKDQNEAL